MLNTKEVCCESQLIKFHQMLNTKTVRSINNVKKRKQWLLAPNSRESRITRANLAIRVTFFSKIAFGECGRVWRVPQMATLWQMRVWRVFKIFLASLANLANLRNIDKLAQFMYKTLILYVINGLPYSP
jgi:hypothetical protein